MVFSILILRFIPTPVGNTSHVRTSPRTSPVHPHARGEHSRSKLSLCSFSGSSPRPWGTLLLRKGGKVIGRFIPTPVGNTITIEQWWPIDRFIPTPVGNTSSQVFHDSILPVHPHARGEHKEPIPPKKAPAGSSPRPWGTQPDHRWGNRGHRFIPTPVGNTIEGGKQCLTTPVHPHARGEHTCLPAAMLSRGGSSPRPWGTRRDPFFPDRPGRFIPTPVGNTR